MANDPLAAALEEIRERTDAATPGPWWFDEDELVWRLHGVHGYTPPMPDLGIAPQVINHQILKAPKSGTPYAEYWPSEADAAFIVAARSDVPRLLAAVTDLAKAHKPAQLYQWHEGGDCGHPEPEDDTSETWSDWDGEHPPGEGLDGYDDQRICLTQPLGKPVCRACTELVRSVTGDDKAEVPASECTVRPVIAAHLLGEKGTPDGS